MEDWSDEQLLEATPRTPAAFAVFYRRHEGAVLGYFMRRAGNAELAADLAAETFAAALLGARPPSPRAEPVPPRPPRPPPLPAGPRRRARLALRHRPPPADAGGRARPG